MKTIKSAINILMLRGYGHQGIGAVAHNVMYAVRKNRIVFMELKRVISQHRAENKGGLGDTAVCEILYAKLHEILKLHLNGWKRQPSGCLFQYKAVAYESNKRRLFGIPAVWQKEPVGLGTI